MKLKLLDPAPENIAFAAEAIRAGEVVIYPTETVYGLGANPFCEAAIERLFQIKERDRNKPVLVIVAGDEQLREVVSTVSPAAQALIEAFWPGPLSLLFPKSPRVPDAITAGSGKICVRCPSNPIARDLCAAVGSAITSSSANLSGMPPATSLAGLDLPGVKWAIDGGQLPPSPPSTIFDPDIGAVLREGAILRERIMDVLDRLDGR